MANSLVAFYSRASENYVSGTIKELSVGNTENAAEIIAELTDADMFKIEQKIRIRKTITNARTRRLTISAETPVRSLFSCPVLYRVTM